MCISELTSLRLLFPELSQHSHGAVSSACNGLPAHASCPHPGCLSCLHFFVLHSTYQLLEYYLSVLFIMGLSVSPLCPPSLGWCQTHSTLPNNQPASPSHWHRGYSVHAAGNWQGKLNSESRRAGTLRKATPVSSPRLP